jgi:hypothetical protein
MDWPVSDDGDDRTRTSSTSDPVQAGVGLPSTVGSCPEGRRSSGGAGTPRIGSGRAGSPLRLVA